MKKSKSKKRPNAAKAEASATRKGTGPGMYTMSVVGVIKVNGYPLQPGEKLVVAKLTPINVVKGAI